MIKVLLVSPTDPKVPTNLKYLVGGENTYTKTLLADPPKGVIYVHQLEAVKKGLVRYSSLHRLLAFLVKLRILPMSSGSQCLEILDKFDLVHCHGYSIKIDRNIPILLSDSSSNYLFLRDYLNWPEWRIKLGYFLRRSLFSLLGVMDADTNPERARKIIVFSQFAEQLHKKLGVLESRMEVLYAGLRVLFKKKKQVKNNGLISILFVGIWFERKGGPLLLEAFKRLSGKYPDISLTIVGEVSEKYKVLASLRGRSGQSAKCEVFDYVPREKLMGEFFPKADVFVLVPPKVEGYGFSVLEAMSFGIPVIVSRVCALPELVRHEKTGFLVKPGSVDDLTSKLEVLIKHRGLRKKMGREARKVFEEKFSIEKSNEKLLRVYRQVLS